MLSSCPRYVYWSTSLPHDADLTYKFYFCQVSLKLHSPTTGTKHIHLLYLFAVYCNLSRVYLFLFLNLLCDLSFLFRLVPPPLSLLITPATHLTKQVKTADNMACWHWCYLLIMEIPNDDYVPLSQTLIGCLWLGQNYRLPIGCGWEIMRRQLCILTCSSSTESSLA